MAENAGGLRRRRGGGMLCATVLSAAILSTMIIAVLPQSARAAKPEYVFAISLGGLSTSDQGQMINMFTEIAKIISAREKFTVKIKTYAKHEDLLTAAKSGGAQMVYTPTKFLIYKLMKNLGYKPFMAYSLLDMKKENYCFYVSKQKKFKTIDELKEKKIVMSVDMDSYFTIRKIISENPLEYFSNIKPSPDVQSAFYSLSMYEYDTLYITTVAYKNLKLTNPGPVKDVRALACSEDYDLPPFVHSKSLPPDVVKTMTSTMMGIHKDEAFKTYWPLMRTFKFRFKPASTVDMTNIITLFEEGEKKGWKTDFDKVVKLVGISK